MNKRILPYNIDAERSVLGAVMLNRRALMDVLEIVKSIVDYIQLMEDKENNASRQQDADVVMFFTEMKSTTKILQSREYVK